MEKDMLQLLKEIDGDPRIALIFAYRYLLNREPESMAYVEHNTLSWKELRDQFLASEEYRLMQADIRMEEVKQFHLAPYEKDFLKEVLSKAPLSECENILEIGCGAGNLTRSLAHFCPQASVIGIDPYLKEWWGIGEASDKNWQVKVGDGQNIEYPADTFDLIVSDMAFEHISWPEKCLEEIKRVLKPNGWFMTHLYLSYDEMFQYLEGLEIGAEQAKHMCDTIYQDPFINRVDIKRFEKMFANCGMKVIEKTGIKLGNRLGWLTGESENELTPNILEKLDGRYTAEELLVCGYTLTMQK